MSDELEIKDKSWFLDRKVELDDKTKQQFKDRAKLTFGDRLRLTWQGKTDVGRVAGTVLDIAETFAPRWAVVVRNQLQQNKRPMFKKILSLRNFINVKDENGNLSWQEVLASVIQIAIAGAVVWGAQELGILAPLMELLTE